MPTKHPAFCALAAAASLLAAACGNEPKQQTAANTANAAQPSVVPELSIPAPEPPLDREHLLIAAIHAASDFTTGIDDRQGQKALADRKFEFRIRFGCGEPADDSRAPFGWSFDKATGALKARATPTLTLKDAAASAIAGDTFESVEGFWLSQPWALSAACPAVPAAHSASDLRSVGIAQFFSATGPRTLRRSGRPYETTQKIEDGDAPADGFDLVLTGRLVALPDGRVIACAPTENGGRPTCIVSAEFGTVSIERADTHEQLAQWGAG